MSLILLGTCLYLSHLTSLHSPLLSDPTKNKWVYGGNVLVDPVSVACELGNLTCS